jgi:hypothetical protein
MRSFHFLGDWHQCAMRGSDEESRLEEKRRKNVKIAC